MLYVSICNADMFSQSLFCPMSPQPLPGFYLHSVRLPLYGVNFYEFLQMHKISQLGNNNRNESVIFTFQITTMLGRLKISYKLSFASL